MSLESLKNKLDDLEGDLADKEVTLDEIEKDMEDFELDTDNFLEEFDEMLDNNNDELFGMLPSIILKKMDPIQYRTGFLDYVDTIDKEEDSDYRNLMQEREEKELEISNLEDEIVELHNKINEEEDK